MKQNILLSLFDVKTEAYQAFTELKAYKNTAETLIAQAILIKKENEVITTIDSLDKGDKIGSGAITGGLLGSLIGVLGGPVGLLFGSTLGMLLGSDTGAIKSIGEMSLLEYVAKNLKNGEIAILTLVQETTEAPLNNFFNQFQTHLTRWNAEEVQAEILAAQQAHKASVEHARQVWRQERTIERKEKLTAFQEELKQRFDQLAEKVQLNKK